MVFGWTLDDLKPCLSKAEVQDQSDGSTIRTELETCLPSSRPCGCNNSDLWNDLYSFIEPDSSPFDLKLKFNDTNSMTLKLIPLCDDWMPEDPKKAYECVPGYNRIILMICVCHRLRQLSKMIVMKIASLRTFKMFCSRERKSFGLCRHTTAAIGPWLQFSDYHTYKGIFNLNPNIKYTFELTNLALLSIGQLVEIQSVGLTTEPSF